MRPVKRGRRPRVRWTDYNEARPHLEQRLGNYCSYCEMPYPTDVEHKLPKQVHPHREMSWPNFLLACKHCNSIKHHHQDAGNAARPGAALALYLWPDTDNTALAFAYDRHNNSVSVAPGLPSAIATAAQATIQMTGVDRRPGTASPPTDKDRRWRMRREAWEVAENQRDLLLRNDTPELRTAIGDTARATGFWSVWRVVFSHDQQMLHLIDHVFQGTASDCFHPTTRQAVARPGGRL